MIARRNNIERQEKREKSTEVVAVCEALLGRFQAMGAQVVEVTIADLEAACIAHVVTIAGG